MKCKSCEEEILNDGELVIKSFAGGTMNYVHTDCHYQHLLEFVMDEYLEYEDFKEEISKPS